MKIHYSKKVGTLRARALTVFGAAVVSSALLLTGMANAAALKANLNASTTGVVVNTSADISVNTTHLQNILTKGNQEIERRLATLNSLTSKITGATKLNASDKATLSAEVSTTMSGLTSLKAQLNASTTLAAAIASAQDIYTQYRVYALVAPKVGLVKVADDQQAIEAKLTALAQKLQTRLAAEQQAGKNVAALKADLSDMNAKVSAAQSISANVESTIIDLQPSDYNSNHSILVGVNAQLKTAHTDIVAAYGDAKNIIAGLKSLKSL